MRATERMARASTLPLGLALAQVIFGGARGWTLRHTIGVETLLRDGDHAAVVAHLDHVEALRRILEHPVLAFELGRDALDRALDAERFAAADAAERLLLLEHARGGGGSAEVELRFEADHLLRARSEERRVGKGGRDWWGRYR